MKQASRIVGSTGALIALIGVIAQGLKYPAIRMIDGGHSPRAFVILGILGLCFGIWLAVAFPAQDK